MKGLKNILFTLAVLMAVSVKGQFNPENPAEPGGVSHDLTIEAVPKEGGSFNLNATTSYAEGDNVSIRAYSNAGYSFLAWEQDGSVVSTSASFTYTMPDRNVNLVARYKYAPSNPSEPDEPDIPVYSVLNLTASPSEGGHFNVSSGNRYEVGTKVELRAYTNSYYTFRNWTENGNVISTSSTFQYEIKKGNPTLVANYDFTPNSPSEPSDPVFVRKLYLNCSPSGAGYFNVTSGNEYESGSSVNLRAYSYQDYTFLNWTVGDSVISESGNFNYTMPDRNVAVTANYRFAPSGPSEPSQDGTSVVNIFGMEEKGVKGQSINYPLYVGNNVDVIGFVVDIRFPLGFEVDTTGIRLSDRATEHSLDVTTLDNNGYRLKVRGGSKSISGNGGKVMEIPVSLPDTAGIGKRYPVVLSNGVMHGADGSLTPIGVRSGYISIVNEAGVVMEKHSVVFISDGDTLLCETLEPGDELYAPEPEKEGFTFLGWDNDVPAVMPEKDLVYTAQWKRNSYNLMYVVDGEAYRTDTLAYGFQVTAANAPEKEGYTFSGWSEIPSVMPAHNVEVTGSFSINRYLLTVFVDEVVFYSDSIAYGERLEGYANLLTRLGIDLTGWEWYGVIETVTMPAYDVIINAVLIDAVESVRMDMDQSLIYDLTGKHVMTDDIFKIPTRIYIRNGHKLVVP